MDFFGNAEARNAQKAACQREKNRQKAILRLQKRYGKNIVLKGMNLQEGATAMERNRQIGGHKA
jgi:DNA polymerase V